MLRSERVNQRVVYSRVVEDLAEPRGSPGMNELSARAVNDLMLS